MAIVRVRDPRLSLWQSAVASVARGSGPPDEPLLSSHELLDHPMVRATNDFVQARHAKEDRLFSDDELQDEHRLYTHLSSLTFDIAQARATGRPAVETELLESYWPYSDRDPKFLECVKVYAEYWTQYRGHFRYNDWAVEGRGDLSYGVIDWRLPNDARVAVIGDWGTGMADAYGLLVDLLKNHRPDAIIHLGDIYYSGTPEECSHSFVKPIAKAFDAVLGPGERIPVFTLPGNHDYYALGYGFYPMLTSLNAHLPSARQLASYFCLRTEDDGWQFLGMDTGYEDSNPANQLNPLYAGPRVQPTEVTWHRDKLVNFSGATILLSHHQVFTANAKINGATSSQSEFPYLNPFLLSAFQPFFRRKIAAWLWGHEHNFVLYQDGVFGLAKGRLEGASAFEEMAGEDPYENKYPEHVPYLDPRKYQLSRNAEGYYSHSYSIIDLSARSGPTDPVTATYYEFPAWYENPPKDPRSTVIFTEDYALPDPPAQPEVKYAEAVHLSIEGGLAYVSHLSGTVEYFPTVGRKPAKLQLISASGASGAIKSGAEVRIKTTEPEAGKYNLLGAWKTHWLYYYYGSSSYGSNETWTIVKLDTGDGKTIRYGDAIYLVSVAHHPRTICPTNDGYFTTTRGRPATTFVAEKG